LRIWSCKLLKQLIPISDTYF